MLVALPGWSIGTALGIMAGNILPVSVVSALSVALYGMFLAVIIPPAKNERNIGLTVIASFVLSFIAANIFGDVSAGTRTIVLTILIAGVAAFVCPVNENS